MKETEETERKKHTAQTHKTYNEIFVLGPTSIPVVFNLLHCNCALSPSLVGEAMQQTSCLNVYIHIFTRICMCRCLQQKYRSNRKKISIEQNLGIILMGNNTELFLKIKSRKKCGEENCFAFWSVPRKLFSEVRAF